METIAHTPNAKISANSPFSAYLTDCDEKDGVDGAGSSPGMSSLASLSPEGGRGLEEVGKKGEERARGRGRRRCRINSSSLFLLSDPPPVKHSSRRVVAAPTATATALDFASPEPNTAPSTPAPPDTYSKYMCTPDDGADAKPLGLGSGDSKKSSASGDSGGWMDMMWAPVQDVGVAKSVASLSKVRLICGDTLQRTQTTRT